LRTAIQQQAVAVLFTDDVGEIRYISGRFNTTGVNRPDHAVGYDDVWDAGPTITAVHSQELAKLGIRAKSVYEMLEPGEIGHLTTPGRENRAKNYENVPLVTSELAQELHRKGQRYLLWVTWSGLQYFHTVLPTVPVEQISSSYWLFDLDTQSLLWSGGLADIRTVASSTRMSRFSSKEMSSVDSNDWSRTAIVWLTDRVMTACLGCLG
jgi:hypothetical protein